MVAGVRHPVVRGALEACDRYCIRAEVQSEWTRRVRIFPCPVMDTAITLRALAAAGGRAGSDPVVDRAIGWLMEGVRLPRPRHQLPAHPDWRGFMCNRQDRLDDLRAALTRTFACHEVTVVGSVALFHARRQA
ncbi:hypothetical protein [Streptomyces sp. NPDC003006]